MAFNYIENQHIHGLSDKQFSEIMHEFKHIRETLTFHTLKINQMALTQEQLLQGLTDASAHLDKIGGETSASLILIQQLKDELANAGQLTPEVEAAFNQLQAKIQAVDDLVQDPPPPPQP